MSEDISGDKIGKKSNEDLASSGKKLGSQAVRTISKPITMTQRGVSKSFSSIKKFPSTSAILAAPSGLVESVLKDTLISHSQSPTTNEDDDIEKSKYIMRSIAGLLGTASVYADMENAQVINNLTEQVNNDLSQKTEKQIPDTTNSFKPTVERRPTLFEISVEPNTPKETTIGDSDNEDEANSQKALEDRIINEEASKCIIFKKLKEHLKLAEDDIMIYSSTAWLLKDVLVQGYCFITLQHFLFFAYLPRQNGQIKMTGNMNLKSTLKGSSRYWCVLKDNLLSLYSSVSEVYFPVITIDLKNVTKIEIKKEKDAQKFTSIFKVFTKEKKYTFIADSPQAAKAWCNALKIQQFTAQNDENNYLSLKIPLRNILELDDEEIINQSVTLILRALEGQYSYAVDEYIFMFLDSSSSIVKKKLQAQLSELDKNGIDIVYNEAKLSKVKGDTSENLNTQEKFEEIPSRNDLFINSNPTIPLGNEPISPARFPSPEKKDDLLQRPISKINRLRSKSGHWIRRPHSVSFIRNRGRDDTEVEENIVIENISNIPTIELSNEEEQANETDKNTVSKRESLQDWTMKPFRNLSDMWKARPLHYDNEYIKFSDEDINNFTFVKNREVITANNRFRAHFSVTDNAVLISTYYAYLNRNIPVYGKLYIGNDCLCFRSLLPGSHTTMILPISSIDICYTEKSVRFGYFALIVVIRGHEELFFEFYTETARNDAESILLRRIEDTNKSIPTVDAENVEIKPDSVVSTENFIENNPNSAKLKFFEDKISANGFEVPLLIDQNPNITVKIKAKKQYRIGLLTIGSRGDVQPYIALGKGLIKEGHEVTIITHSEFREFVELHGIKFKEIAGNPAELMALMVEHESMNIGMLREASKRFGGWIKELLDTAWIACKDENFDILVESPSCIPGIHIAEALQIAYFRAFTMPWTRTRAYPHAFIVPDQKRGGNYNYLTYVLFENIYWKGTSGAINKWRIDKLGLEKTNLELLQQNKVPFLYNVSPTIFPPSVDFSEWVKVTGYWFLDEKSNYSPPKELTEFISKARKLNKELVYIGFGSIVVSNASEMTLGLIEAVQNADVYCILNKGWSERLGDKSANKIEVELPECIFNGGTIPHDWLFPQIDAAMHHGGSGTTGATLRAGLPTVIKPFFGDQFFYANRVEEIGVGIALKKYNVKDLSKALVNITTNLKFKEKADLIKRRIAKEDGVRTAINCIYGELEYARSLMLAKNSRKSNLVKSTINELVSVGNSGLNAVSGTISHLVPKYESDDKDSWIVL